MIIETASLLPYTKMYGTLRFVRVEWWLEAMTFSLLRYSIDGTLATQGLRMDMDKRTILDDPEGYDVGDLIRADAYDIWLAVVNARYIKGK